MAFVSVIRSLFFLDYSPAGIAFARTCLDSYLNVYNHRNLPIHIRDRLSA